MFAQIESRRLFFRIECLSDELEKNCERNESTKGKILEIGDGGKFRGINKQRKGRGWGGTW